MKRREFFALPAVSLLAPAPRTQQPTMPGTRYRDYSRCLPNFLRGLAAEAYERRNRALTALTTTAAVRERQRWVRDTFWKLTGGRPDPTPLNARVLGGFERTGYKLEKIVYESLPGFHITANLYIPAAGKPPYPGILFQLGHSLNGKAYPSYQRCCQSLAKLGFVVLAFDPVGQGERVYYPGTDPARTRLESADDEHTMPGRQMLLTGDTMTRLQTWDAVRSLDYLAAHPLVDPARLGSAGQSGGGTLTMMLGCVDDRLAAAFVASGNTENVACASFNPPGSTDDAEQNFVGSGPLGFDRWDLLYPLAPKPVLVSVSAKDFFGTYSPSYIENGEEEYRKLARVYRVLGKPEQLEWTVSPLPHSLAYDSRVRLYNWFLRWLKPGAAPVEREPETNPDDETALRVSESGSTVRSFGSLTPFRMNAARPLSRGPADVAALLGVAEPSAAVFAVLGRVPSREVDIEAVEVASAARVWLPAWMFVPRKPVQPGPVYLLVEPNRNARWREDDLYQDLAASSALVCVPNLRGLGDLSPEYGRGNPGYTGYHQNEENYAWASLIFGKPLLGQWVTDIRTLVRAVLQRPEAANRRLVVAATGKLTVAALLAASLEPGISTLYLSGSLISLRSIVDTENYTHTLANIVPSFLQHTDLPEIASSLSATDVILAGAVDAAGKALAPAAVQRAYPRARILPIASWDAAALIAVGRSS